MSVRCLIIQVPRKKIILKSISYVCVFENLKLPPTKRYRGRIWPAGKVNVWGTCVSTGGPEFRSWLYSQFLCPALDLGGSNQ